MFYGGATSHSSQCASKEITQSACTIDQPRTVGKNTSLNHRTLACLMMVFFVSGSCNDARCAMLEKLEVGKRQGPETNRHGSVLGTTSNQQVIWRSPHTKPHPQFPTLCSSPQTIVKKRPGRNIVYVHPPHIIGTRLLCPFGWLLQEARRRRQSVIFSDRASDARKRRNLSLPMVFGEDGKPALSRINTLGL